MFVRAGSAQESVLWTGFPSDPRNLLGICSPFTTCLWQSWLSGLKSSSRDLISRKSFWSFTSKGVLSVTEPQFGAPDCCFGLWVWMRCLVSFFCLARGAQDPSTGVAQDSLWSSGPWSPSSSPLAATDALRFPLTLLRVSSHSESSPAPLSTSTWSKPALKTGADLNFGGLLLQRAFPARFCLPLPPRPKARYPSSGLPLYSAMLGNFPYSVPITAQGTVIPFLSVTLNSW